MYPIAFPPALVWRVYAKEGPLVEKKHTSLTKDVDI